MDKEDKMLKLDKIQFAVPNKHEGHFGDILVCISMSIGNSSPTILRAIGTHVPPNGGASKQSATSFVVHTRW
jgi:hypothetical protein